VPTLNCDVFISGLRIDPIRAANGQRHGVDPFHRISVRRVAASRAGTAIAKAPGAYTIVAGRLIRELQARGLIPEAGAPTNPACGT
jgi:hypothetical protein